MRTLFGETAAVEHRRVADTWDCDDTVATSQLLRDLMHYAEWLGVDFNEACNFARLEYHTDRGLIHG